MWIRFGTLGFSQIIYQVLILLISSAWIQNSKIFLVSWMWSDHVHGLSGRVPCYACGGTPPCGLDRHGGPPLPRETWGGASGVRTCGRDVALRGFPWHGWGLDHSGVTGFVFSPMSGRFGPSCVDALPERWLSRIGRFDVLSRAPWFLQLRGEDFLPVHVRRLLARLRLGQDGVSVVEIFELWKDWQGRSRRWVEPWWAVEANVDYIPPMCRLCGVPTWHPGGIQVSSIGSVSPSPSPPLFRACCDRVVSFDVEMRFSTWRKFMHQAVVLAAAFQPGRYAVEAGGVEPDAASNLAKVQVARVREFREKNLLLADEDFAFAFSSYDEAVLAGGDFLGQEWARIRLDQDRSLMAAGAAAVNHRPQHSGLRQRSLMWRQPRGQWQGWLQEVRHQSRSPRGLTCWPMHSRPWGWCGRRHRQCQGSWSVIGPSPWGVLRRRRSQSLTNLLSWTHCGRGTNSKNTWPWGIGKCATLDQPREAGLAAWSSYSTWATDFGPSRGENWAVAAGARPSMGSFAGVMVGRCGMPEVPAASHGGSQWAHFMSTAARENRHRTVKASTGVWPSMSDPSLEEPGMDRPGIWLRWSGCVAAAAQGKTCRVQVHWTSLLAEELQCGRERKRRKHPPVSVVAG